MKGSSMEKRIRTKYSSEFKAGAVKLVREEGKSIGEVAKDLGVIYTTLKNWVYASDKYKEEAFPGQGNLRPEDAKIKELEKKLKRAEMERDLLKKTIVFFAEQDRKNSML